MAPPSLAPVTSPDDDPFAGPLPTAVTTEGKPSTEESKP
jgi:hypothetical protein